MPSDEAYYCRVCGLRLDEPPWGADGRTPLYEHCPCCGVEFGYQDATRTGAKRFRAEWLASGARWDDPARKPPDWDVTQQLESVPEAFR